MKDTFRSTNRNSLVLCRSIDVWERQEDAVLRYRCFELLGESKYWVQSCDYYRVNDESSVRQMHERAFIELFQDNSLADVDLFDSLEEAIEHERASYR